MLPWTSSTMRGAGVHGVSTPRVFEYSSTPAATAAAAALPLPSPHLAGNVFCKPKCPRSLVATVHGALSYRRVLREGVIWTLISQIVGNDDSAGDSRYESRWPFSLALFSPSSLSLSLQNRRLYIVVRSSSSSSSSSSRGTSGRRVCDTVS